MNLFSSLPEAFQYQQLFEFHQHKLELFSISNKNKPLARDHDVLPAIIFSPQYSQ